MELQYVNCQTNELDIQDLMGMVLHKGYLIINQQRFLSVWDAKDPENLKKISEFRFPQRRNNMRLFGDELYVWGKWDVESHIHILDVSDPARITQKQDIALQDEMIKINGLYVSDGRIFAAGLTGGIMEILRDGTVNTLLAWNRGIGDILVHESLLITTGGSIGFYGFRLFELGSNGLTEIKDVPSQFSIPSNIAWWEKGKSVILLGREAENVIKIDVSNPIEAKKSKIAKTGVGLCWQFARDGDNIYVLGIAIGGKNHLPAVCVIDASETTPKMTYKQIIHQYKEKSIGSNSAKGIVKVGDYLILATYRCMLGVVKIIH